MYQKVVLGDPLLDELNRYPTNSGAARALQRKANAIGIKLMHRVSEEAGIYFFFSNNCPECGIIAQNLKLIEREYKIHILPITMDGSYLPEEYFSISEQKVDAGQSETIGVEKVPAVVLVKPPQNGVVVLQGAGVDKSELIKRLMLGALSLNLITQEEFASSRPVKGLNEYLHPGKRNLSEEELRNPQSIINYINNLERGF